MFRPGLLVLALFSALPALPARAASPDAEAARQKGLELSRANQLPEAITELEKAAALDPNSAEIHADLGNTKLLAGDLAGATSSLETAVKLKPDLGVARYNLAYALRKSGQFGKAADQYRIFLTTVPNDPDAHYGLAESLKATGDKLAAAEAYDAYANAERRPAQARWVEKARATAVELRASATGEAPLARANKEKTTQAVTATPGKKLSFSKTAPTAAAAAPTEVLPEAAPPKDEAKLARARPAEFSQALRQLQAGDFGGAEPTLAKFAREHPDDALATAALGSARLGILDGPGAEQAFGRALGKAPREALAGIQLGLGEARRLQGKDEEAKVAYRLVLEDQAAPAPIRRNAEERLAALP
jgi:tetratricopeptide (TPR) repeat protein